MPELPEVETVCRALASALTGRTVLRTELFSPAVRTPLAPLEKALPGRRILDVFRRARYIVAPLDNGLFLVIHLGMTGVIRIEAAEVPRRKHEHVFLHLDNGLVFRYEDVRRFGSLEVHPAGKNGLPEMFDAFGPEPLSEEFTPECLYARSRGVRGPVKAFLMDNAVVTGIGNIYAAETLFAARIDPRRPAGSLTRPQCRRIVGQAKRILLDAIGQGGTTIADFKHVDGTEGKFAVQLQVYGKAGCPCPVCGAKLGCVKIGGRTSVFCPRCQK
ncbi:MAG: bifunctional DNA-formamidopyrimidine glycosylase/DNA-(apurinic or apyrimidinic site) lyase [Lentisphaeria bacterium]|nr:bifunctional DNA-formamidopyrimidine glycosylase/DNA-(apurinic or apyrimidinic site) lyase [Lentisphaeria bacterium]